MNNRIELHEKLEKIEGVKKVYYQPPASVRMKYPCIVYNLSNIKTFYADDNFYNGTKRYSITVIDSNPDSEIPDILLKSFKMCSFDRIYIADNLYHNVFILYY